ncbi:zinc finger BED domain-containing protein 5-like [Daktulosphaira vitifoliae]|uniref:zinc finger BED domain-containing protein 5-like n=1 Tax=Daktulosphaira vitifoliae TaxID=58002 RepID=UPI0021A9C345|nr:zinc finger BED domain-containing protein 5-like [Daktulosphaira vitifoliae]
MSKQSQMTNFFKRPPKKSTSDDQNSNKHNLETTDKINEPPLKKVKILKYNDSYIEYGFTYFNENGTDVPQCVICSMTLANASLKPNKLIRHLETNHAHLAEEALKVLIPFSTTYLCEYGFSTLTAVKNKTRNRLEISATMRLSLTNSIKPRIDDIISNQQQQPSH